MALGDVEEHKRMGRIIIMCFLAFSSCNHVVKVTRLPLAGDPGHVMDNFAVNFNSHVLAPVDHFRLTMGEGLSRLAGFCPQSLASTCEAGTTGLRFVLGLH